LTGNVIIIPAYNEENSIAHVLADIPKNLVDEIIVVNNSSNDNTATVARENGATVLNEPIRGYGNACLRGINYLKEKETKPTLVIFLDADYSDYPQEAEILINKINEGFDFVVGSRIKTQREKGSMTPQQIFGNWLAVKLIKLFHKHRYYDLGPFRAIKYDKLTDLKMQDKTYGWTVEMQIKALKNKLKIAEVPVTYRKRIGKSKISGTIKGSISAGYKIIKTIFKYR
jgi:glycosyltransferase involved in cell wall biosynthesis